MPRTKMEKMEYSISYLLDGSVKRTQDCGSLNMAKDMKALMEAGKLCGTFSNVKIWVRDVVAGGTSRLWEEPAPAKKKRAYPETRRVFANDGERKAAGKLWRKKNREKLRRYSRDKYRAEHGIPLDAPVRKLPVYTPEERAMRKYEKKRNSAAGENIQK